VPGKGNPAGIVLDAEAFSAEEMQALAARTGFPDTAFVSTLGPRSFRIRYFSPRRETELCGHATIAASLALHRFGALSQDGLPCEFLISTNAGVLPIRMVRDADGEIQVVMTQLPSQFQTFDGDLSRLAAALGVAAEDLHPSLPVVYGSTGRWTLVVPTRGLNSMRRMAPEPYRFPEVLTAMPGASIHPFCLQTETPGTHMHARHFSSPGAGTLEDPVTGTASGVLGAYYRTFVEPDTAVSQPIAIEQGYEIGREGRVLVWAEPHGASFNVRIAGTACFVAQLPDRMEKS